MPMALDVTESTDSGDANQSQASSTAKRERRRKLYERLSKHSTRPEVVTTPGVYSGANHTPFESKKLAMSIKSNYDRRKNVLAAPTSCAPDTQPARCEHAFWYTQPKTFSATFSSEPRFGWTATKAHERATGTQPGELSTTLEDTERGYLATRPKSYAVNFNQATSVAAFPKDPLLLRGTLGPAPGYYTSDEHTMAKSVERHHGGAISQEKRNMNWAIHFESPGPIYNPNYASVESVSPSANFCGEHAVRRKKEEPAPGPFKYADGAVAALHLLSTSTRSPCVHFSTRPSASAMPFPFNVTNFYNSGTMRTRMRGPAGQEARDAAERHQKLKQMFWKSKTRKRAQAPLEELRPKSAPAHASKTDVRGASAACMADMPFRATSANTRERRLKQITANPLKAVMRVAECGYEISSIMAAVSRSAAPAAAEAGASRVP